MFVYAVVLQEQSQPNENLQQAGADILALNVEFVKRINHTEPGSVSLFLKRYATYMVCLVKPKMYP